MTAGLGPRATRARSARSRRGRIRTAALLALGLALGAATGLHLLPGAPADPASAHATVVATTPAHGSELDEAPREIRVVFDEPVTLAGLADPGSVIDADGERVDSGAPTLDDTRTVLTLPIRPDLPEGVYIASWRAVSADTHPVGGSIQFGYGVPVGITAAPEAPGPDPALTLAVGVAKGAVYLGLIAAFGLLPAALVLGGDGAERRRIGRIARIGLAVVAASSLAQLAAQFLWIRSAGASSGTIGDASPDAGTGAGAELAAFAVSPYAIAVWLRLALLAAAALIPLGAAGASVAAGAATADTAGFGAGPRRERLRLGAFLALGLLVVGTVVANGHGGAGSAPILVSTLLHALAAIAWAGGLALLGWLLLRRRLTAERLQRLPRWSLYAALSVAALALSGLLQAIDAVGFAEALTGTSYGAILLAKLALVAVALLLGLSGYLWARTRLREAAGGPPAPGQTARLRGRVRWETGIAAVVVLLSGVLSSVTPAQDEWAPVAHGSTELGPYEVTLEAAPARIGPQSFRLRVLPPERDTAQPAEIELVLRQLDGPVADLPVDFTYRVPEPYNPDGPAATSYISASANVPAGGRWQAQITLVVDRFEQYSGTIDYVVR